MSDRHFVITMSEEEAVILALLSAIGACWHAYAYGVTEADRLIDGNIQARHLTVIYGRYPEVAQQASGLSEKLKALVGELDEKYFYGAK